MIRFDKVSVTYEGATHPMLRDIDLELFEGEMVLVVGRTGSGKTTFLQTINGLMPHFTGGTLSGRVTIDGRDTQSNPPRELADLVGVVPQDPASGFVADTVEEELAFGMEALNLPNDVMRKRVEETLDLLSLAPLRNRALATLSGGEQQRVAIASALVAHPKVLVLDEPTSALDPIAAEEVLSILHRLVHDLSLTVIIAEHKLERVIQFADRIVQINGAGSTMVGTPEQILMNSPIAPPIVELARALGLNQIGTSVREMRRLTSQFRETHAAEIVETKSTSHNSIIEIKDLTISYGEKTAISNVTTDIYDNEIVAIMGRNGAGKSSLLKAIAGISHNDSGSVIVNGHDSQKLFNKLRRQHIGFVPQEPSDLLYAQTVNDECKQADTDNEIALGTTFKLLQQLVPGVSATTHPRDLSEGQRLGLALSVVLSSNPALLILDEPTRGLDYQAKRILTRILIEFARTYNKSVVIATHDVELVAELATRTIFIADGDIVADGPTIDVLLSSPAFAPQVSKVMSPQPWLTVADVVRAIEAQQ
jgi:energy-coupling factor transport system ATP-binding protein